eukprot:Opistho-2@66733
MSVSMIPTKRPYDLLEGADVPASPMHLMKRCRYTASSPPSSPPHAGSPSPQHVYRRPHVDSAFVSTVPAEPVERYLPTAKRRRTDGTMLCRPCTSSTISSTCLRIKQSNTFTPFSNTSSSSTSSPSNR